MKFTVKFKTLGMTLVAGEVEADRVENAKPKATDLIERRHLKNIEYSAIVAPDGSEAPGVHLFPPCSPCPTKNGTRGNIVGIHSTKGDNP